MQPIPCGTHLKAVRGGWAVVLVVSLLLAVPGCATEETQTQAGAEGEAVAEKTSAAVMETAGEMGGEKKTVMLIEAGETGSCQIIGEDGKTKPEIPRKYYAVWKNKTNLDIYLTFGTEKVLFDVYTAKVRAKKTLKLPVLEDADIGEHGYLYECGGTNQPGAKIIVPPPPPPTP